MEVFMKIIKSLLKLIPIACVAIMLMAMMSGQGEKGKPWDIPAKYKDMKSAVKSSPESIQAGEALYKKNCASCHGKAGLGDGPKAKTLETFPGDFSSAAFQGQTDGTLFYQTKFGRDEMPKYDKKIEDSDIWNIVNFMRTLKI
jgi:mono/diheme cytochrome c family protein